MQIIVTRVTTVLPKILSQCFIITWVMPFVISSGYYIYAEASFPRQNGDRAQLFSPKLIGDYCLQFYYYMYGAQMGALHVVVLVGAQRTKLGSITGDRGQKWYKVDTDIRSAQAYQVEFSGLPLMFSTKSKMTTWGGPKQSCNLWT